MVKLQSMKILLSFRNVLMNLKNFFSKFVHDMYQKKGQFSVIFKVRRRHNSYPFCYVLHRRFYEQVVRNLSLSLEEWFQLGDFYVNAEYLNVAVDRLRKKMEITKCLDIYIYCHLSNYSLRFSLRVFKTLTEYWK